MKQSKLRTRRVVRYAILYFVLLVLFLALLAGPAIIVSFVKDMPPKAITNVKFLSDSGLIQPAGYDNNNTNFEHTGTRRTGPAFPTS